MMINLNPVLPPRATLASDQAGAAPGDPPTLRLAPAVSPEQTAAEPADTQAETAKKRIKRLKQLIEQLQQKLRRANERMAAIKTARYRNEEARVSAIMAAKGHVVSLNSALTVALSTLFEAEKQMIASVNLSV